MYTGALGYFEAHFHAEKRKFQKSAYNAGFGGLKKVRETPSMEIILGVMDSLMFFISFDGKMEVENGILNLKTYGG